MKKIVIATALVLASSAHAQEKNAACLTHGWSSTTEAGNWCERNKIREGCYK
jgi:hypothetical protein